MGGYDYVTDEWVKWIFDRPISEITSGSLMFYNFSNKYIISPFVSYKFIILKKKHGVKLYNVASQGENLILQHQFAI